MSVQTARPPMPLARAWAGLRFGWSVAFEAIRDFVWADLREGILDLRGLGSATRALVWLGFGLMLLVIVAILQADAWRQAFPLVPLTQGLAGRGRLVPEALIPVTYFLLSLAWAFVLAGALRSRRAIRLGILALWILDVVGSLFRGSQSGPLGYATSLLTLLGVIAVFVVFPRTRPRRVFELLALLVLVGANNAVTQASGVASWQASGMPLVVMRLSFEMVGLTLAITPLLLLVGMDVASFTFKSAGWVAGIAEARLPSWTPGTLLAVLLGWRLWEVGGETAEKLEQGPLDLQLLAYIGGLAVPVLVGLAWLAVRALAPRSAALPDRETLERDSKGLALPLVLASTFPLIAALLLSAVALVLAVLSVFVRELVPLQDTLLWLLGQVGADDTVFVWHIVVGLAALGVAVWLARRGRVTGALFLGVLGLLDIKSRLTSDGRPLDVLNAAGPGHRVEIWWVLLFTGLAVVWLLQRRLTPERAGVLAFLTLITLLLKQTDFISNRFSPFFDSSGLGFIAFGIAWDALTIGSWANVSTRGLPRVSRIFLYLGYVLMTVTVINWAAASHDLGAIGHLTGDLGLVGLEAFGKPLLYAIFAVTLAGAWHGLGVTALAQPPDDPAAAPPTEEPETPPPASPVC